MKMGILGISGKMGNKIYEQYKNSFEIVGIDLIKHPNVITYSNLDGVNLDVLVDFSSPSSKGIIVDAINKKIPILSGTTGYELNEIEELEKLAISLNTKFYWSCNYAKGINLFKRLIKECNSDFKIFDFVEIHATTKKDKPSGTAKVLAKELKINESEIQSLRLSSSLAIHELIFTSDVERIIVRHEVINSKAFIDGFNEQLNEILGEVYARRII